MSDKDGEAAMAEAWARRFQDLDFNPEALVQAARTAERLGRRAGVACCDLPFESEPSGFLRARRALLRRAGS